MTTADRPACDKCGERHIRSDGIPSCTSHRQRDGHACGHQPVRGLTVCGFHGGGTKRAKAAGKRRVEEVRAQKALTRGLRQAFGEGPPPIDPAEAMLAAVSMKWAEVLFLRAKVAALDDEGLVWGITRVKDGGDDRGTTHEAKPNIWWSMLRTAEEHLVKFAAAARAAGIDERRTQLAEQQGGMVVRFAQAVLDAMLDVVVTTLRASGQTDAQIEAAVRQAWTAAVGEVVPREFRRLSIEGGAA